MNADKPPASEAAKAFRAWVLDPARTNDELLLVSYFLNWGRVVWGWKHKNPRPLDFDAERAEQKRRRLNPALRPAIDLEELEATLEVWPEVTKLESAWGDNDRPVRNLAVLRFLPHLEQLNLHAAEVRDLSPLAASLNLKQLQIDEPGLLGGFATSDLSALAGLPIEKLNLSLRQPWIDYRVLTSLPNLREVSLRTNLITLETLPALPVAEIVSLDPSFHFGTPARSFRALPQMPRAKRLKVGSIASLEGVETLLEVQNLDLEGTFSDLTPLAALPKLTFLRLQGELFTDLAPLARLPKLRDLLLVRETPFDLSPLTDSSSLRDVRVERCDIVATELAALNAALDPDQNDFLADTPRPLQPLRFITYHPQHEEMKILSEKFHRLPKPNPRNEAYGADLAIAAAESRWAHGQLKARLERVLGPEVDVCRHHVGVGHAHIKLHRYEDSIQLRAVIQELREFSASSRYPWNFLISVESHAELDEEMEEIRQRTEKQKNRTGHWLASEFDPKERRQEHEHYQRRRQEEYERLAAEHRLRLRQEQNLPVDEEEFLPINKSPESAHSSQTVVAETPEDSDTYSESDQDDEDESDLMEAPPGETIEDDFLDEINFVATLEENIFWASSHHREEAEYVYGQPAEDWHALPEPIQNRPRPD